MFDVKVADQRVPEREMTRDRGLHARTTEPKSQSRRLLKGHTREVRVRLGTLVGHLRSLQGRHLDYP